MRHIGFDNHELNENQKTEKNNQKDIRRKEPHSVMSWHCVINNTNDGRCDPLRDSNFEFTTTEYKTKRQQTKKKKNLKEKNNSKQSNGSF